jgi:hypothetical protein
VWSRDRHRSAAALDLRRASPQEFEPDPRAMWAGLLSAVETTGDLDTEAAMIVMDLERALHLLSRLHADAAAVVAARVMSDFTDFEMDAVFPQVRGWNGRIVRPDWRRLRDRSVAWLPAYLQGAPISSDDPKAWTCERAFRDAR